MLRLSQIKLSINHKEDEIKKAILKTLNIDNKDLISYKIYKQSIDARRKKLYFVYTLDIEVKNEEKVLKKNNKKVTLAPDLKYKYVNTGEKKLKNPPIIVGSGPAGLFAGLILAEMGYNPIIFERGKNVEERTKDVERFWKEKKLLANSNVQFGEGGAGTFSDGKLTTQIKNIRCRKVLEEFIEAGAPKEIIYKNKPHVGTDILKKVVVNIRKKIISLGGKFCFESQVTDLIIEDNKVKGVIINNTDFIESEVVVLALGHSARDTFEMLYKKI
ncbi:hypothetical protein [Defluviitalea phaphyphila]|nr:hypothetical protein [Defluviitalea phaphyphila]